jgi:hypothetical protein
MTWCSSSALVHACFFLLLCWPWCNALLIQLPPPHGVEFDGCRVGFPWFREECLGMDVVALCISQLLCIMREMADHMPRIWAV